MPSTQDRLEQVGGALSRVSLLRYYSPKTQERWNAVKESTPVHDWPLAPPFDVECIKVRSEDRKRWIEQHIHINGKKVRIVFQQVVGEGLHQHTIQTELVYSIHWWWPFYHRRAQYALAEVCPTWVGLTLDEIIEEALAIRKRRNVKAATA